MENLQYLVHRMYPDRYTYNRRQTIILYYEKLRFGLINDKQKRVMRKRGTFIA